MIRHQCQVSSFAATPSTSHLNHSFSLIVKSRSFPEAHFKSVRLFRRYCRMMPFVVHLNGTRRYATPDQAKLQLAKYWRSHNKVRDPWTIDIFVARGYERLYNIHNGDIWGGILLDQIAPVRQGTNAGNEGFSYHDDVKFEGKSSFLKDFYKGGKKVPY